MKLFIRLFPTALMLLHLVSAGAAPKAAIRTIPRPLPGHPGNVFLAGEDVIVPLPPGATNSWRLVDYHDNALRTVLGGEPVAQLGRLPTGFYRLRSPLETHSNWISLAVLEPLKTPTPASSPIALDVAMAWFYPTQRMDAAANLCALAGANWVRDRLNWGEMEPRRAEFKSVPTRYDESAAAQSRAGLQVLQVNHSSPRWAGPDTRRFPEDLRDAFNFYREMARRWRGQVQAFEPWNEADIPMFGGHTGAEMAALQKSAFLGLKAGNPDVIVGQNVFASHNVAQLEDLRDNVTSPYFDTFNLHHYEAFELYPALYADFRSISAGKPLWVTEAARPVKWSDEMSKEPSDGELREQSERLVKTFALSLHEGAAAMFYFLLPDYVEGQTQFGVLRADLTPRPAFVSLAAVGRLLADARPLGQSAVTNLALHGVWFEAVPGGRTSDVLVAWTDVGAALLTLPAAPIMVFDHLGAVATVPSALSGTSFPTTVLSLNKAPVFAVFPAGTARRDNLRPPPSRPLPDSNPSRPAPVVFQAVWPPGQVMLKRSACRIPSDTPTSVPVWAYNFSKEPARGTLQTVAPGEWKVSVPAAIDVAAMGRTRFELMINCPPALRHPLETVRLTGDFGRLGEAVLSLRLLPEPLRIAPDLAVAIPNAGDAARWRPMVSGGGTCRLKTEESRLVVAAEPAGDDKWFYPVLELASDERPPAGATGLMFSFTLIEGTGEFRVIFDERNGSGYVADFSLPTKAGESVEQTVFFSDATFGSGWSKPDLNHRLDANEIVSFKIGGNTKRGSVRYSFDRVRWVKF